MNQSDINSTLMDTDVYYIFEHHHKILQVSSWPIVAIGIVLTPVAIFAVSSLVKKDNIAPILVINLLVSDVIQLCAIILTLTRVTTVINIGFLMYYFSGSASVGFMMFIALERYLLIVWPLWYRTRRTVKMSVLLCAVVWTLPLFDFLFSLVMISIDQFDLYLTITGIFLLLPFPLLIFFLVGTVRALAATISVRAEEKRRIIGLLVLVLLIYTLLFLPVIIFYFVHHDKEVLFVALFLNRLNPLADLFLYIFLRKGAVNQIWFCLCCCRKNRTSRQPSSGLNDGDTVTSL